MPTKKPKNVKADPREMELCEELLTAIPSVRYPSEIASIFSKSPQGIRNFVDYLQSENPQTQSEVLAKVMEIHDLLPIEEQTMTDFPMDVIMENRKVAGL